MTIILKYYWLQAFNFWRQLGRRVQLEIFFLCIVFFSFFTTKFITIFSQWLARPEITPFGLSNLLVHLIMLLIVFSTPFIYHNLIPRQKGLLVFGTEPLSARQAYTVLFLLYLKYQLLILLISLPVFSALLFTAGVRQTLYTLLLFIMTLVCSLLFIQRLADSRWSYFRQTAAYFLFSSLYFTCFYLFYRFSDYVLCYDLLILGIAGWLFLRSWRLSWHAWDRLMVRARALLEQAIRQVSAFNYFTFPHRIPAGLRPILIKEILSYVRNRKYQRLKLISLAVFIIALSGIHLYFPDDYLGAVSLLTFILIWEHYSHQFSEKYVKRDPPLFYKSLPLKFRYLILSKFISEFIYILSIVIIIFAAALWHGLQIATVLTFCLMVMLVAAFLLYIIILMRLIFYDRPRFAGYAYHLMILVMVMLTTTYFLVGPIISLIMLLYLNYISYRQFVK